MVALKLGRQADGKRVLTLGKSDWATAQYHGDATDFRMRVTVRRALCASSCRAMGRFGRSCGFAFRSPGYRVGPMCCTPKRARLMVVFSEFRERADAKGSAISLKSSASPIRAPNLASLEGPAPMLRSAPAALALRGGDQRRVQQVLNANLQGALQSAAGPA
jgi:hypothetical protein